MLQGLGSWSARAVQLQELLVALRRDLADPLRDGVRSREHS
jgi:hypothetical protein